MAKNVLVRDTFSADHFAKEVKVNMSDLSEILEQCGDTIFKVSFKKKVDPKNIEDTLMNTNFADLSDPK